MTRNFADPSARSGITFEVDQVVPADWRLETAEVTDFLGRRLVRKVLVVPDTRARVVDDHLAGRSGVSLMALLGKKHDSHGHISRLNPLVEAIHCAFAQHRPLVLSPDVLWITIAQGFSHHVTANAEKLRPRLVRHEGRTKLEASVEELTATAFAAAVTNFSKQIRDATDQVLHETLVCDFSTTTPLERTASEIVMMDTYSSYFDYVMQCVCGIPCVTLEGTLEDWEALRARIEVLAIYELEWWVSRLRPICDELIATASGRPSREFWKGMYKPAQAYATTAATGWLTDLFPYLGDAAPRQRNATLEVPRNGWALPADQGVRTFRLPERSVGLNGFPSGLSSTAVTLSFPSGERIEADLVAGFLGVSQDDSSLALKPMVGWSLVEKPPARRVMLTSHDGEPTAGAANWPRLRRP
jgi:hypothetical protein